MCCNFNSFQYFIIFVFTARRLIMFPCTLDLYTVLYFKSKTLFPTKTRLSNYVFLLHVFWKNSEKRRLFILNVVLILYRMLQARFLICYIDNIYFLHSYTRAVLFAVVQKQWDAALYKRNRFTECSLFRKKSVWSCSIPTFSTVTLLPE